MVKNSIRQLIIDLVNDYDDQGYILSEEIVRKYEKKIEEVTRKTRRNSDVFDINGNEIFEGDTIRYYWGNEVTGKKYEDVVFFEKGSFYAGSFKKLAVADQVEIIKRG